MRELFQREWFGVDLMTIHPSSCDRTPDEKFYDEFYQRLFTRMRSFEDLPPEWRRVKMSVGDLILHRTQVGDKVMSIGCGLGFVEAYLASRGRKVVAIEPSKSASRLLENLKGVDVRHGFFPDAVSQVEISETALLYMVSVEYSMDNAQLARLLAAMATAKDSDLLLISTTVYKPRLALWLRRTAGLIRAGLTARRTLGRLWGYERTKQELLRLCTDAEFMATEDGEIDSMYWVYAGRRSRSA